MQIMKCDRRGKRESDCFFYLFLPFVLGFFLGRTLGLVPESLPRGLIPAALLLLLFVGTSVYGRALTALLFAFFGFCLYALFPSELSIIPMDESTKQNLLFFSTWVPAVFAAAYLGLRNVAALRSSICIGGASRLKRSLCSTALQLLILMIPALISLRFHP